MAPVPIHIRPVRPDDAVAFGNGWLALTPETQRRRFLAPKPRLSESELRYLTDVDGAAHVALVAVDRRERILGVARFIRLAEDPKTAEFAVVVGDVYQRHGVGTALAAALADRAREGGVERLTALMLHDNVAARRLMQTIGERLDPTVRGSGVVEYATPLAA
ncbi:MAG: GCN5-related N-acetyltransferase [Solirubrobacterales bacterium]|nr:GCN5-related N-acetyltransferase [Solirubrobacterales bacterium]